MSDELNELTALVRRWSEARAWSVAKGSYAALCMAENALENWLKDHPNAPKAPRSRHWYAIPSRLSIKWHRMRDKLLDVPKPECDHPNNWLGYFDRLRDAIEEGLEP